MRIPYLKWITYAIMPLVYDQSLSYVELLNKVVAKLNEVIEQTNNLSTHIDNVLAEWLETPEAKAAVQESIGKYIDEYAKTPDFNAILVNALSTQSVEIAGAARSAAENWLNSEAGRSAIGTDVDAYMETYINTDAFKTLVSGFVASLDDIKRGTALDIRQKESVSIAAPSVVIDGCQIANDYSKSPGYQVKITDAGIAASHGNDPILEAGSELDMHVPLNMGENLIINVKEPVSPKDAANKAYVDSRIGGGAGGSGIKYIELIYSAADDRYHSHETFTEVMAAYPNVAAVFANENRNVFFPISTNGASIVFGAVTITEGNNVKLSSARRVTFNSDNVWTYVEVNDSNANYVRINGSVPFTASQSMGGNRLVSLADPVNDNDAATLKTVRNAAGIVLYGTATFNADGRITEVNGVDFSSVAAAALANVNILLVLTASNVEETYIVMRYVGKKQLATSGANRYRYTFIGSNSISGSPDVLPDTGNVYGLDFNEGDDPMRQKDAYFISRGVCDFHVTGTGSPDGALQSVTFKASYTKADFDNLLAQGARIRLVVEITGETRYFEMCYTTNGVTAFGGMYIDNNESANIEIVSYNGTTFFIKGLATYGGEIV